MFTSTLNRLAASVRCVSSTAVVNAKLPDQLRHGRTEEDAEKRKNPKEVTSLQSGTQTLNSCRSLDYARGNGSIIYFNDLSKPISMLRKSTHLQVIPQQSNQNSKFAITTMQEKLEDFFFIVQHGCQLQLSQYFC